MISFCHDKLSPAIPEWADAMAYEWIARIHATRKLSIPSITLDTVRQAWKSVKSHYVSEGHLPQEVPRAYWMQIIMTPQTYKYLMSDPSGKEYLDWIREVRGSGSIVIKTLNESGDKGAPIRDATFDFTDKTGPTPYRPTGFTFGMNSEMRGDEVQIPVTFPKIPMIFIYFTVVTNATFDVTLSNTPDLYHCDMRRITQTLRFHTKNNSLEVLEIRAVCDEDDDDVVRPDPTTSLIEKFDDGLSDMFKTGVHYRICLNYEQGLIYVGHSGASLLINRHMEVIKMAEGSDLRYISFSHFDPDGSTTIWNLRFSSDAFFEDE